MISLYRLSLWFSRTCFLFFLRWYWNQALHWRWVSPARAAIFAIAKELRDAPADPDLVDRARRPLVEAMTKARRENAYWLNYVAEATSQADRLDRSRNGIAEVEAATPEELQALAQRYLTDDKALVIKAVSDKVGK